jgi:hypothetical protein
MRLFKAKGGMEEVSRVWNFCDGLEFGFFFIINNEELIQNFIYSFFITSRALPF